MHQDGFHQAFRSISEDLTKELDANKKKATFALII